MAQYRVLDGLPPYGPAATPFPSDWGRLGREGMVVQFTDASGNPWTANFLCGAGKLRQVTQHPDLELILVVSGGDAWSVDPERRTAERFARDVEAFWVLPNGLLADRQGLAFLFTGPRGIVWHTRRLSWDGFDDVRVGEHELTALAWSAVDDRWIPCSVDLQTGRSEGGAFSDSDTEGWEHLATVPG